MPSTSYWQWGGAKVARLISFTYSENKNRRIILDFKIGATL
jgi:hypothetical protein